MLFQNGYKFKIITFDNKLKHIFFHKKITKCFLISNYINKATQWLYHMYHYSSFNIQMYIWVINNNAIMDSLRGDVIVTATCNRL